MDDQDDEIRPVTQFPEPRPSAVIIPETPVIDQVVTRLEPLPVKVRDKSPRESPRPTKPKVITLAAPRPEPVANKPEVMTKEAIVEEWFKNHFHNTRMRPDTSNRSRVRKSYP